MKNTINLLSFTAAPIGFWEKLYIWALSIGRYVIIITELIVLAAFFYKFKIDTDLANTKADIDRNVAVMKQNYSQLQDIRNYQSRISTVQFLTVGQSKLHDNVAHTLLKVPANINIDSFNINADGVVSMLGNLNGIDDAQLKSLQDLNNTFKNDGLYTNVSLSNISTSTAARKTTFNLTMNIKKQ